MSTQLLLHQDGKWLLFDGGTVKALDSRPRIDQPSVVLTDFDGAVSDVTSLEGSPSHAVALIERRLRADGLIESDSKVLIHQLRTVGAGYQALFTAVPLDRWQQMFAWADSQADHCLLVPTVGLLWKTLKPGRGVVLHSGRKLVFLAALRNSVVHASALAFSESREDLAMTVAALGDRAGTLLSADEGALEPLAITWISALTALPGARVAAAPAPGAGGDGARRADPVLDRWPVPDGTPTERNAANAAADGRSGMSFDGQDEYARTGPLAANDAADAADALGRPRASAPAADGAGPLDEALLEIFSANSGTTVTLAPHAFVTDADGVRYRSGVLPMLQAASASVAVNSGASRAMFLAERFLPWASAASLLLAIGLGALGGRWTLAAHDSRGQADALQAEIATLDARVAELAPQQAVPSNYPALLDFIDRATALSGALDPTATLMMLRDAAGPGIRILRMRLDPEVVDAPTLRVDGIVNYDAARDPRGQGQEVARFVQRLRDAGYVPVAIDPQAGNARSGAPGGVFSYQLTRASATPSEPPPFVAPVAGVAP